LFILEVELARHRSVWVYIIVGASKVTEWVGCEFRAGLIAAGHALWLFFFRPPLFIYKYLSSTLFVLVRPGER
jgi:hypothetical protein